MASRVKSAVVVSLLGGLCSVPFSLFFFGPAPIIAVGLVFGTTFSPISAAAAGLVVLVWTGGLGALSYLALTGIPSVLAVRLSISRKSSSLSLDTGRAMAAVSIFGVCVILFLISDLFGLGSKIEAYVGNSIRIFFDEFKSQFGTVADPDRVKEASLAFSALGEFAAKISVGALGAVSFLILAVNVSLAEKLTNKIGASPFTRPDYSRTQPPAWLSIIFLGMIGISLLAGDIGKIGLNCSIFLSIPFILTGLAVIHSISGKSSNRKVALRVFYALVFVLGVMLGLLAFVSVILALLGAFECWISIRERIHKSSPD